MKAVFDPVNRPLDYPLKSMKIDFDGIQAFVVIAELGGFQQSSRTTALDPDGADAAHPETGVLPGAEAVRPYDAIR